MSNELFDFSINNDVTKNDLTNFIAQTYDYVRISDSNRGSYPSGKINIKSSSAQGRDPLSTFVLISEGHLSTPKTMTVKCATGCKFKAGTDVSKLITPNAAINDFSEIQVLINGSTAFSERDLPFKQNFTNYNKFTSHDMINRQLDTAGWCENDFYNQKWTATMDPALKLFNWFTMDDENFQTKSTRWNTFADNPASVILKGTTYHQNAYSNYVSYDVADPTTTDFSSFTIHYRSILPLAYLHDWFAKCPACVIASTNGSETISMTLTTSFLPTDAWTVNFSATNAITGWSSIQMGYQKSVPFSINQQYLATCINATAASSMTVKMELGFQGGGAIDPEGVSLILPVLSPNPKLESMLTSNNNVMMRWNQFVAMEEFNQEYFVGNQVKLIHTVDVTRVRRCYLIPLYNPLCGCQDHLQSPFTSQGMPAYLNYVNLQVTASSQRLLGNPLSQEMEYTTLLTPYMVTLQNGNSIVPENADHQKLLFSQTKLANIMGQKVFCLDLSSLMNVRDDESDAFQRKITWDFLIDQNLNYPATTSFKFIVLVECELLLGLQRVPLKITQ